MKTINYAQRLRKTRLFLNLTQRELSVRLGVSASTISRYENGRTAVSPRVRKWVNRKYRQFHLSRKVIKSSKDHTEAGAGRTPTVSSLTSGYRKCRTSLWRADFKGVITNTQSRSLLSDVLLNYRKENNMMKKYDLCVKSGTYTDRNGNEKVNWENVGVMMENGNDQYLLIKPWVNFAGFPREEGRTHLIISLFEHKENDQRSNRNSEREDFNSDVQNYEQLNSAQIPF